METETLFLMDGVKLEALKTDTGSSVDSSQTFFFLSHGPINKGKRKV